MGGGLPLTLLSQMLAFLNMPVDERLDELEAIQLVVVVVIVQLKVVELQLLLAHLAHVLVRAQHLTQVLLDVCPVLDMCLLTNEAATRCHLGGPSHRLLLLHHPWLHPWLWDPNALLLWHELLWHLLLVDTLLLLLSHLRHLHLGDVLWNMHLLVLLHLAAATQHQSHEESPTPRHTL